MPEPNDTDLRKLFQTAGHAAPAQDLTDRIMAQVAVTRIVRPEPVAPLIGLRGWVLITIGLVAVITYGLSIDTGSPAGWSRVLAERFGHLRLPQSEWGTWMTTGSGLALLFTAFDVALRRRQRIARH